MEYIIKGRKPEGVFRFFEEISRIPRGSGNEKGISDYLEAFAAERGLFVIHDEINNVFIRKAATKGRENEPSVMLQAHTDMVCEKNENTVHDFLKDPLDLYLDESGNILRARGTTLGADDGIGVALMLCILDSSEISHPEIECLFTVSEETGMEGVNGFDFSNVKAEKLINLDSEDVNAIVAGCAGGVRANIIIKGEKKQMTKKSVLKLTLGGLAGGHSGENIADGRANANKLLGRVLLELQKTGYELSSINGGGKSNAIPRECRAVIVTDNTEEVERKVADLNASMRIEMSDFDKSFFLKCEKLNESVTVFDESTAKRATALLGVAANGVFEMNKHIAGFVEYSRNLGVVVTENNEINFTFFARSAVDGQLEATKNELNALAYLSGGEIVYSEEYHGWNYEPISPLREKYIEAYREVKGGEPKVLSIHAGLECGIIKAKIPTMDIVAVGPCAVDIHSPDEHLYLDSVEEWAEIVIKVLENR